MQIVEKILFENADAYEGFTEYFLLINKAKKNLEENPDICIECCKSLIEGICQFILIRTGDKYTEQKDFNGKDMSPLIKEALESLVEITTEGKVEDGFIKRCASVIHIVGEVRNARGDISHGNAYPKEKYSDLFFSKLVFQITEGMVEYMLQLFILEEITEKDEMDEVIYENNEEFNNYIDEPYDFPNKVKYSRSLYEQDFPAYEEQLLAFKENNEQTV